MAWCRESIERAAPPGLALLGSVRANQHSSMHWYWGRFSALQWPWLRFGTRELKGSCKLWRSRLPRMFWRASPEPETSLCSEELGQASVEAAFMLPILMLLLALLLQPAFLLYTRSVMQQAAAEGARVLMTYEGSSEFSEEACRAYVARRLEAVPNIAAFHVGGSDSWTIETSGGASSEKVSVVVEGLLRPLPLVGITASMLGEVQGDEVVLRVEVEQSARPSWLENNYSSWISEWGS